MNMRYFINLLESEIIFRPISELIPEQQKIALDAFAKLANDQRGKPETLGTSTMRNPGMFNATGAFCYLAEHIGDLTHRMSQKYCEKMNYGYENVLEKVNRGIRYFENGYGLKKEVEGNIKNNFGVRREENPNLQFVDFVAIFKAGAKAYADAHAELIVYNPAQWHAKQAAVSLGNLQYDELYDHLKSLKSHLENKEAWCAYASLVMIDGDTIKPYNS